MRSQGPEGWDSHADHIPSDHAELVQPGVQAAAGQFDAGVTKKLKA